MQQPKHIVIIAGEESGDQHAALFVRALQKRHPTLILTGIGGKHMRDAGVELISDLARYGVTGITEVLTHARVIRRAFQSIKLHLQTTKPDLLILVDYPGFNLRLARFAKETLHLKILYYISPQIWAWKANRIHSIKRYVDRMAVILPFEKKLYEEAGIPVVFVGHPLVEKLTLSNVPQDDVKQQLHLPLHTPLIAVLPGSRHNEIKRHMPVLCKMVTQLIKQTPNVHIVIPVARSLVRADLESYFAGKQFPVTFVDQQALWVAYCSDFVVVASGTASLECALLTKPMCIIYKSSLLTFIAASKLMRVKYLGLCNILANQMIVPEFLQYDCNPKELVAYLSKHLINPNQSKSVIHRLQQLKDSLSQQRADIAIDGLIEQMLKLDYA